MPTFVVSEFSIVEVVLMMSNWFGICSRIQRNIGIVNVKNEKKHIRIIRNVNYFGKYPLKNAPTTILRTFAKPP